MSDADAVKLLEICFVMRLPHDGIGKGRRFFRLSRCPVRLCFRSFIHSFSQISLLLYVMNCWNNFDKTDIDYLLAPTDDLIRFWRSR